jgi:Domain of unknown function (DUF4396)
VRRLPREHHQSAFRATVHWLTGCAIGEVLGLEIASALGWTNVPPIALAVVLAFTFGYALSLRPIVAAGVPVQLGGASASGSLLRSSPPSPSTGR